MSTANILSSVVLVSLANGRQTNRLIGLYNLLFEHQAILEKVTAPSKHSFDSFETMTIMLYRLCFIIRKAKRTNKTKRNNTPTLPLMPAEGDRLIA